MRIHVAVALAFLQFHPEILGIQSQILQFVVPCRMCVCVCVCVCVCPCASQDVMGSKVCFEKQVLVLMTRAKYQTTWRWGSCGRWSWRQSINATKICEFEFWVYMCGGIYRVCFIKRIRDIQDAMERSKAYMSARRFWPK